MATIGRGLVRLRDFRWDIYAQPMREMRLEMQIVFLSFHLPFGSGTTLNVPVLTMIKSVSSAPGQVSADQPESPAERTASPRR
jgi:hypothetical protein